MIGNASYAMLRSLCPQKTPNLYKPLTWFRYQFQQTGNASNRNRSPPGMRS